jgi:hypothetical protein
MDDRRSSKPIKLDPFADPLFVGLFVAMLAGALGGGRAEGAGLVALRCEGLAAVPSPRLG